jgi:N-acetylneuraminic acid mutarotase
MAWNSPVESCLLPVGFYIIMQRFIQESWMKTRILFVVSILLLTACSPTVSAPASIPTIAAPTDVLATFSLTPDLAAKNKWMPRAPLLTARSEMPAVELNGLIYVPGGFGPLAGGLANGKGPVNTLDVYDPSLDQWHTLAPMPDHRHHQMVTVYKDRIYVFGGFLDPWLTQSNAWVYDSKTDQWTVLKDMPAPRTAGAALR